MDGATSMFLGAFFGGGTASGRVTRIARAVQTVKLASRVVG